MEKLQFKKICAFAKIKSDRNPASYIRPNSSYDITDSEVQNATACK